MRLRSFEPSKQRRLFLHKEPCAGRREAHKHRTRQTLSCTFRRNAGPEHKVTRGVSPAAGIVWPQAACPGCASTSQLELQLHAGLKQRCLVGEIEPIQRARIHSRTRATTIRHVPARCRCESPDDFTLHRTAIQIDIRESSNKLPPAGPSLEHRTPCGASYFSNSRGARRDRKSVVSGKSVDLG